MRKEPQRSYLGLWPPPFASINHSCAPNASLMVLGRGCMLIRAASHIRAGQEVCVSYLGAAGGGFAPAPQRQRLLSEAYGFTCGCDRCQLEARLAGSPSLEVLAAAHARVQKMQQQAQADPRAFIRPAAAMQMRRQLTALHAEVEAAVDGLIPPEPSSSPLHDGVLSDTSAAAGYQSDADAASAVRTRAFLTATALDAYTLHGARSKQSSASDISVLQVVADTMAAVLPGSYSHARATAVLAAAVHARYGAESLEGQEATDVCVAAHKARYGRRISDVMLTQLANAH